ncbi:ribonuclease HII, degrades RNA of DNA-RNA hybrids [Candidatus Defluviicoccus seviourii]|uniref:Ribonuclease HII n=1 Tax=Candidatus Defluviicoccus seviourii TaxID=2565273 RepID=A0A564WGL0_9PROT|nr:ribonuclease HII, degrades RNA of DNA-RNA hybrids [Candidatus Defluviicoccus seviourii]
MPDFTLEEEVGGIVAGVDEAGRGPLAGPVVAAAVIIDRARLAPRLLAQIDDSKRLSRARREAVFEALADVAHIGIGQADVDEIDRINILQASLLAMRRAVAQLRVQPETALIDGNRAPELSCRSRCVVGGDRLSVSIAAASIVAKVTRDRLITELARLYPGYGWERNAGYGTKEHLDALQILGITPHHRRSFRPVSDILRPHENK